MGRVQSVVFRGFGGRLKVIFRLKESNIGLYYRLIRSGILAGKGILDSRNLDD